jgi:hypothetical protein
MSQERVYGPDLNVLQQMQQKSYWTAAATQQQQHDLQLIHTERGNMLIILTRDVTHAGKWDHCQR